MVSASRTDFDPSPKATQQFLHQAKPSSFLHSLVLGQKSRKFPQKMLDPGGWLCYTLFYLSDERFLFARFFPRAGSFPGVPNREAMLTNTVSK